MVIIINYIINDINIRILVFIIGEESMFKEDGIEIIENFLPEETLKKLNRELNHFVLDRRSISQLI